MWSLRWHFTNKFVTGAPYSIKSYSYRLSHSWTLCVVWIDCVVFSFFHQAKRVADKNVSELTYFASSGMSNLSLPQSQSGSLSSVIASGVIVVFDKEENFYGNVWLTQRVIHTYATRCCAMRCCARDSEPVCFNGGVLNMVQRSAATRSVYVNGP